MSALAKVFLSHRTPDKDLVVAVGEYLRRLGHDVWLDTWCISLGDSIVERINHGLSRQNVILLFCSAHDPLAPWISREWMSSLARKLSGQELDIIPILLAGGRLPAILADISYVSITSADDMAAMCTIAQAISD